MVRSRSDAREGVVGRGVRFKRIGTRCQEQMRPVSPYLPIYSKLH